ncbi:UNVERIFIED_CONTAM: hypothetical protein Slati_4453300 [Sesamum latifolium]|uniref:Uncharacterized protein n=1 Tax=Sesamum latifolium TaxID=2727402 RepID=A0AAW2STK8_9LAMI
MTNKIQKQYDRLDDVPSIMLRMKKVYAVPNRHIRYATTKAFFGTKMTEGSSVQSYGVKMLSLVEKLEDLKAGLDNDTYIDTTTHKSAPVVLVGEALTSKVKGKRAGSWKRKKGKRKTITATGSPKGAPAAPKGKGKGKVLDIGCGAYICNNLQVLERSRRLNKEEMILRLGDRKGVATEAVGSLSLVNSDHIRIELKNCYYVPNVCGLLNTPTRGGYSYFITFTDDHSRYGYVYLIRNCGVYFYDPSKQKVFISRNAIFLEKDFPADSRRDEVLLEESSEAPQQKDAISFEPLVPTDGVPVLRRSSRESRPPERYGFVGLTSQLDNYLRSYGEAMLDIDSNNWLEAMKSEMDSMGSNQVWTLVNAPKGVRPVGCE